MSFQTGLSSVPQLARWFSQQLHRLALAVGLPVFASMLFACSSVPLQSVKPAMPANLAEANEYIQTRYRQLEILDYELNEQMRACYKRFFVSGCVDDVRALKADYRRRHVEVQGAAMDMIRLDEYAKRRNGKTEDSPSR